MRKFKICLIFGILLVLFSCEKEIQEPSTLISNKYVDLDVIFNTRVELASKLSMLLEDDKILTVIEQACLDSKMGDPEILFSDLVELKLPNGTTIGNSFGKLLSSRTSFDLNKALDNDPLLNLVLMPGRGKDREQYVSVDNSKKVYIDKIFNEFKEGESIKYFIYGKENVDKYNRNSEPNNPYFALKQNEEYLAFYTDTKKLFYQPEFTVETAGYGDKINNVIKKIENVTIIDKFNKLLVEHIRNETGQRSSCGLECERDCVNGKDAITQIYFTHDYEGWPRGGPEFRVQSAFGTNNNVTINPYGFVLSNQFSTHTYKLPGDEFKWYTKQRSGDGANTSLINFDIVNWSGTTHTRDMVLHWSEDDGNLITFSIPVTLKAKVKIDSVEQEISFGFTATFVRGDDEIGTKIVQYCDFYLSYSQGYEYYLAGPDGDIRFYQKDRGY